MHPTVTKIQELEAREKTAAAFDGIVARLEAIESKINLLMQTAGLVEATKKTAK